MKKQSWEKEGQERLRVEGEMNKNFCFGQPEGQLVVTHLKGQRQARALVWTE